MSEWDGWRDRERRTSGGEGHAGPVRLFQWHNISVKSGCYIRFDAGFVINPSVRVRFYVATPSFNPFWYSVCGIYPTGKPVASICHGPWLLVSAKVLAGKSVTCFHSIKDDVINAG